MTSAKPYLDAPCDDYKTTVKVLATVGSTRSVDCAYVPGATGILYGTNARGQILCIANHPFDPATQKNSVREGQCLFRGQSGDPHDIVPCSDPQAMQVTELLTGPVPGPDTPAAAGKPELCGENEAVVVWGGVLENGLEQKDMFARGICAR